MRLHLLFAFIEKADWKNYFICFTRLVYISDRASELVLVCNLNVISNFGVRYYICTISQFLYIQLVACIWRTWWTLTYVRSESVTGSRDTALWIGYGSDKVWHIHWGLELARIVNAPGWTEIVQPNVRWRAVIPPINQIRIRQFISI